MLMMLGVWRGWGKSKGRPLGGVGEKGKGS